MYFQPRYYQTEAEEATFQFFAEYGGRVDEFGIPIPANPLIALPTGTGKSVVIANTLKRIFDMAPRSRVMMLTHVKELVEQNKEALLRVWPNAPVGVYSASLKKKVMGAPITFGNVQSVVRKIKEFGHIDIVFIDEAHLVPPGTEGIYHRVFDALRKINPWVRFIGYTATKFRMGQGLLTDDGLFTKIAYDLTTMEAFNRLVAEEFLSPLITKRTSVRLDVKGVGKSHGDYKESELQAAVDKNEVTWAALQEALQFGYNRNSWLVFCSGVAHAEHAADMLNYMGIPAAAIHAELAPDERDRRIAAFKSGELRALTNNNILTTGFDYPPIDFIICLRPTISVPLWVQMMGRGTRPSPDTGKENCLAMDFAGNTDTLGAVNNPRIPGRKGDGGGPPPIKYCEDRNTIEKSGCGMYAHISSRYCSYCQNEFIFETHISQNASNADLLETDEPIIEYYDVSLVTYNYYLKTGSKPTIKVDYMCYMDTPDGTKTINLKEFVALEHPGARYMAADWWRQRSAEELPLTVAEALTKLSTLRTPRRLKVHMNAGKHPKILEAEYA